MSKRYAILDANGVCLNVILVDDPYPSTYWPGYGRYATCADEGDVVLPDNPDITPNFTILSVRPTGPIWIGCTMDIATGDVTPPPQPEPAPEEPQE